MFDFLNTSGALSGGGQGGGKSRGGGSATSSSSSSSSSARAASSAWGKSKCERCDGMHPSSSCPFYKKKRTTPAADQSRNDRINASSQRERVDKLQKKR